MTNILKKYKNDIILLGIIVVVALVAIIIVNVTKEPGSYVVVVHDQNEVAKYSINEDIEIKLTYEENEYNTLVIKDGKVYMTDASCKDHICVKHHKISMTGETIVCLPNKVVIKIIGSDNEVDVTT